MVGCGVMDSGVTVLLMLGVVFGLVGAACTGGSGPIALTNSDDWEGALP